MCGALSAVYTDEEEDEYCKMKRRMSIAQWLVRVSVRGKRSSEQHLAISWWIPSIQNSNNLLCGLHISLLPRSDCPWCMLVHGSLNNLCWSTTGLYRLEYRSMWMVTCARSCVTFPHLLRRPGPVCFPGQVNSFWARAFWRSSLWKSARRAGCMWGTGEKKNSVEHTSASLRDAARRWKKHRYPGTMTKLQVPLRSSGTWIHRPLWESEKSLRGSSLHSCVSFSFKKSLPWCFRSKCRSCPWQARFKRMLMHPRPFK